MRSRRICPASRTSSRPFTSSTPILSRPTVGRSRAEQDPRHGRCPSPRDRRDARHRRRSRRRGRARSTAPRTVGQRAAIAGRSMPGMVLSWNFASAISAPVLPAETARSASPRFTASIAIDIEDFQRPWRSAWLGLASIAIATSVWMMRDAALSCGRASSSGSIRARSPNSRNSMPGCRSSEICAPGTTTDGPKSPPMASSAIRTLSGMDDLEGASTAAGPLIVRQRRPRSTIACRGAPMPVRFERS